MTDKTDKLMLKDHEIRQLVNELRDAAIAYAGADSLRGALSRIVKRYVTHAGEVRQRTEDGGQGLSPEPVAVIDKRSTSGFMITKYGRDLDLPHGTELFAKISKAIPRSSNGEDSKDIR